jgi:GNAT superfamily N-acetyltransferase
MGAIDGDMLVPMSEADVEASVALIARAMNADEGRWAARTMEFHFGCRRHGLDDGRMYHVYRSGGTVAGLVGLHHVVWGPEENVWLAWFAVDPDRQGQGLGRRLLTAVERLACEKGYRKLLVETYGHRDFDKARRFYEGAGFCEAGRVAGYLPDGSAMVVYAKGIGGIEQDAHGNG